MSEHEALYGLDPMALAQLALKDASKVVEMEADWPRGHILQVDTLRRLEAFYVHCIGLMACQTMPPWTCLSRRTGQCSMQPELAWATPPLLFEILVTECPCTTCCTMQGAALTVLERYDDAEKAYMEGLALGPTDPSLHAALKETRATFGSDPSSAPGPSTAAPRPVRQVHPAIAPVTGRIMLSRRSSLYIPCICASEWSFLAMSTV